MSSRPSFGTRAGVLVGVGLGGFALLVSRGALASSWQSTIEAAARPLRSAAVTALGWVGGEFGALPALLSLVIALLVPLLVAAVCASRSGRALASLALVALAAAGWWHHAPSVTVVVLAAVLAVWLPGVLAGGVGAFVVVSSLSLLTVSTALVHGAGLDGLGNLSPALWRTLLLLIVCTVAAGGLRLLWGGTTPAPEPADT